MTSPDAPSTTMRPFLKRTPHALHNVLAPVGPFLHNGVFCVRQHAHVTPASGNASFSRSAPGFAESDENVAERRRPASVVSSDSTDDLSRRRAAEAYTPFKNPIGSYEPPFVVNAFDGVIAPGVNIFVANAYGLIVANVALRSFASSRVILAFAMPRECVVKSLNSPPRASTRARVRVVVVAVNRNARAPCVRRPRECDSNAARESESDSHARPYRARAPRVGLWRAWKYA
mmetsp:Transcript_6236/g.21112  ORF Transcript_6236/g.21112 Transcript_6236/m.21112 type:complete len:231 (+) Transcript_6236:545-1237(+)